MDELQRTSDMYKGLMEQAKKLLKSFYDMSQTHRCKQNAVVILLPIIVFIYNQGGDTRIPLTRWSVGHVWQDKNQSG